MIRALVAAMVLSMSFGAFAAEQNAPVSQPTHKIKAEKKGKKKAKKEKKEEKKETTTTTAPAEGGAAPAGEPSK